MTTDTSKRLLDYIRQHTQASPKDLYNFLGISSRAIFKQLKSLLDKGIIEKIGSPPKVYYKIAATQQPLITLTVNPETIETINQHFYYASPQGEAKIGMDGFKAWCSKQSLEVNKTALEYAATFDKYAAYKQSGLIDGMHKLKTTFDQAALDALYYLDFYAIERFGKTKLGHLLFQAKSGQNKQHINALIDTIAPTIKMMIERFDIDAVGFIPATVRREVQFMNEMKKRLPLNRHTLTIIKTKTPIIVPQKTLSKLAERVQNAKDTLIVEDKFPMNNILLIDDAVGSGSTLNETAAQIKHKGLCKGRIIGLAIVGSFKGFDVISEV